MHAIIRRFSYNPAKLAELPQALAQVRRLHESQRGYAGSLVIDDGTHLIAINLWDSEQAAAAGRDTIGAEVRHLLEPLMSGSPQLIGTGIVAGDDRHTVGGPFAS